MSERVLSKDEKFGLVVAVGAHGALFLAFALQGLFPSKPVTMPPRMVVSLATDISLQDTAPNPSAAPQAAIADTLSPEPDPAPEVEQVQQQPPVQHEQPQRTTTPPRRANPTPQPTQKPPAPSKKGGGSRIGDDFLAGSSTGARNDNAGTPASAFGPSEQASLVSAISRQLRPHWTAPQGVDAEKLVTLVRFRLDRNGRLIGEPEVVQQSGQTASNASQVGRHGELAIRAVKLASPFDLPSEYYDHWKTVTSRFDRNLSR